jgi:hypothetical protein
VVLDIRDGGELHRDLLARFGLCPCSSLCGRRACSGSTLFIRLIVIRINQSLEWW